MTFLGLAARAAHVESKSRFLAEVRQAERSAFAAPRGYAFAGTGASMTGWGTLVEYLMLNLETLCGHWQRAGERVGNPRTVMPALQPIAQAQAPWPAYGFVDAGLA